ncbi:MAG TPA: hypothetical protein VGC22_06795, partial [Chitinophaga sp.]
TNFVTYQDWTNNIAIKKNDFNLLRIELRDHMLYFLVNGQQLYRMPPVNDASLDRCGLFASHLSILQADNFKAIQLN